VKNHGGFIEVQSEVGKGTHSKLSHRQERNLRSLADETRPTLPMGNGELVLVVDDESAIRQIARATLESYGYRVITANDGAEAVALYERRRPKSRPWCWDSMMPLMDGGGHGGAPCVTSHERAGSSG